MTHQMDALALMSQHLGRDSQASLRVGSWTDPKRPVLRGALCRKHYGVVLPPGDCGLNTLRTDCLLLPRALPGLWNLQAPGKPSECLGSKSTQI